MIKKTAAISLTAALLYTTVAPAVPALAADIESAPIPAAEGAPRAGAVPDALPSSLIMDQPRLDASAAVPQAAEAPQAQPAEAAQAADAAQVAAPDAVGKPIAQLSPENEAAVQAILREMANPPRIPTLHRILNKFTGGYLFPTFQQRRENELAQIRAMAAAGKFSGGPMGLRPLSAPALPKGVRLDQPPTLPPAHRNLGFTATPSNSIQLPIAPINAGTVESALRHFVASEPSRFKVPGSQLKTVHVRFVPGHGDQADTYFAAFQQTKDGLEIDGARLTFMVKIIHGMAEVVDVDAHLYPTVDADTRATLNDDELKQKAEEKLALPQSVNPEYKLIRRKICFIGNKWRAVNVYSIPNVKEARGVLVAVDVATGETFAWDARHGMMPPVERAAQTTGRIIVSMNGSPSAEKVAAVKAALGRAGIKIVDSIDGPAIYAFLVEGEQAAVQSALAQIAEVSVEPETITGIALRPIAPWTVDGGVVHATAEDKDHRPNGVPELVEQTMPYINATVAGQAVQADVNGKFDAPRDGDFSASLDGKWATIIDQNNKPVKIVGTVKAGPNNVILATARPDDLLTLNQLNMYIWIHRIHDWWSVRLNHDSRLDQQIPVNVNVNDECNAYYTPGTPSLNFFRESDRCSDTGRPGVGAHEYGHFVDDQIGGIVNGGMSEGWGDIGSMFLLGTPIIGEGFLKNQNPSWIRNGENNYQYNENDEVHAQGQAWMGFAWKLRQALRAKLGEAEGQTAVEALIVPTMFNKANDIPGQMAKVLLNATKKDGTVMHEAEIRAAAKAHGITLPGDKSFGAASLTAPYPTLALRYLPTAAGLRIEFAGSMQDAEGLKKQVVKALTLAHIDYRDLQWSLRRIQGGYSLEMTGKTKAVEYMQKQITRLSNGGLPAPTGSPRG